MTTLLEGMSRQRHAPASLYPGKHPVPIVQEAGWAPGPVWTSAEKLPPPPPTGTRSAVRPARSQSLYRLSYGVHDVYSNLSVILTLERIITKEPQQIYGEYTLTFVLQFWRTTECMISVFSLYFYLCKDLTPLCCQQDSIVVLLNSFKHIAAYCYLQKLSVC
jgi:hypothetical protein